VRRHRHQPLGPLVEQPVHRLQHVPDTGDGAQRRHRALVGRVLVRPWAESREPHALGGLLLDIRFGHCVLPFLW
jgi:hypothetical protein